MAGGRYAMSRALQILSAGFTSFARLLRCGACDRRSVTLCGRALRRAFDILSRQFYDSSILRSETVSFLTAFEVSFFQRLELAQPLRHGGCAGGSSETSGTLPPIGMPSPGNSPPSAPLVGTPSVGDAAMAGDYGKLSREALIRANQESETAIFWGLVITVILVVVAMIKGMFG